MSLALKTTLVLKNKFLKIYIERDISLNLIDSRTASRDPQKGVPLSAM